MKFDWEEHWKDMPEFIQEKKEAFSKIVVRFDNEEDLNDFSRLIGQKLTPKTKSIWHPYKPHVSGVKREWVDQDES